jgi:ribosomal protein L40E
VIDYAMNRTVPAVLEAVESGVCRHCGGARTPHDAKLCPDCGRCPSCQCSPTCITRKPAATDTDAGPPAPSVPKRPRP